LAVVSKIGKGRGLYAKDVAADKRGHLDHRLIKGKLGGSLAKKRQAKGYLLILAVDPMMSV
jgi:hypothetical protein